MSRDAPRTADAPPPGWRHALRVVDRRALWMASLPLLTIIALWPTAEMLWSFWTTRSRYSHGLLVLAMSVLSSWWISRRIDWSDSRPSRWGWMALAVSALCWLLAVLLDVTSVHGGLLAALLACAIWASNGGLIARQFAIPVLLLLCALPVWDPVTEVLQVVSLRATGVILNLIGIPAVLDGFHVLIPAGTFEIESGCSGIAYFIVALAIGLYIGASESLSALRTLAVTAVLAGTAIVANWIRIVVIIYAGHATQMQHTLIVDGHYGFGWALFGVFFLSALWIVLSQLPARRDHGASPGDSDKHRHAPPRLGISRIGPPVVFLALVALVSQASALQPSGSVMTLRWPTQAGDYYREPGAQRANWHPSYPGAATESMVAYRRGDVLAQAYAGCYTRQRQGAELVGYDSSPAGLEREFDSTPVPRDSRLAELSWRDAAGVPWIGVQTFRIGKRLTSSSRMAKLLHLTLVLAEPAPICTIVVAAPCTTGCGEPRAAIRGLAASLVDEGPLTPP